MKHHARREIFEMALNLVTPFAGMAFFVMFLVAVFMEPFMRVFGEDFRYIFFAN